MKTVQRKMPKSVKKLIELHVNKVLVISTTIVTDEEGEL